MSKIDASVSGIICNEFHCLITSQAKIGHTITHDSSLCNMWRRFLSTVYNTKTELSQEERTTENNVK